MSDVSISVEYVDHAEGERGIFARASRTGADHSTGVRDDHSNAADSCIIDT